MKTPLLTTFGDYDHYSKLLDLIRDNPPDKPLLGIRVVFSGGHPNAARCKLRSWVESLGASTRNTASAVTRGSILIVNRHANLGWSNPAYAGRKIERAQRIDAYRFRFADLIKALRECCVSVSTQVLEQIQGTFDFD